MVHTIWLALSEALLDILIHIYLYIDIYICMFNPHNNNFEAVTIIPM